ncbi:hypothetical protein GmRootA79_12370 [Acidovorax sp. A79]
MGWFALLVDEYMQLGKHVMGGVGFVSNFVLWRESGYFDNSAETKILLHLWSLGIEEQFYIIWPLLLWLAYRCKCNLLVVTATCTVVSFGLNLQGAGQNSVANFYSPQTRFWELQCGSLLAWFSLYGQEVGGKLRYALKDRWRLAALFKEGESCGKSLSNLCSFLGSLLLAYGFWRINKNTDFPGIWAAIPILGAVLIILAGPDAWINKRILSNRLAVWIGLISFPLYLWHWPLLSFARIVEGETPSRNVRVAAVALSIVLAWLTYRFIERPVRSGNRNGWKVALLTTLMLIVGFAGYFIYDRDGLKSRSGIVQMDSINAQFVGPGWKFMKNDTCLSKYPLVDVEKYGWWFCMASSQEKPTLLLLGNSFANHLYPGLALNDDLKHHSVLSIGACDPAWVEMSDPVSELSTLPCSGHRQFEQQELINNIVLKEKSIRYAIIDGIPINMKEGYIKRLQRRVDFLEKNGVNVILFSPHVRMDYDIKNCYARPLKESKRDCQISAENYMKIMKYFNWLVDEIRQTNPKILAFNQNSTFCNERGCQFKLPVMPAFRDEYFHLSEFASKLVAKEFAGWAKAEAPDILVP